MYRHAVRAAVLTRKSRIVSERNALSCKTQQKDFHGATDSTKINNDVPAQDLRVPLACLCGLTFVARKNKTFSGRLSSRHPQM